MPTENKVPGQKNIFADLDPAAKAMYVMRAVHRASLGTIMTEWPGGMKSSFVPYVSLVLVMVDHDGTPYMLLSDLAEHTRNFLVEPQISLLFDNTGHLTDPLTGVRVTVLGTVTRVDDVAESHRLLDRFFRYHHSAEGYAGFADFNLYKVDIFAAHIVAGFGDIHWIRAEDLVVDTVDSALLIASEADIVDRMNTDYLETIHLIATHILGCRDSGWRMAGIDRDGWDLNNGRKYARCLFEKAVLTPTDVRLQFARQTTAARQRHESDPYENDGIL